MDENVKRILTKILNASKQGNLSFFVGAGVSMLSGQPSWNDLLKNIKSLCDVVVNEHNLKKSEPIDNIIDDVLEEKINGKLTKKCSSTNNTEANIFEYKDNYAAAQILFDVLGKGCSKDKFIDIVKSCFNTNSVVNDIHEEILSLNPISIITTNFDNLIEKACMKQASKYVTVASDDEVSSIQGQHFILKIHGDFEHKNIVFTEDSYLDYERDFPLISRMLTSILATNIVVFIGYSLTDFNIRLLVNILKPLYKKIENDKKIAKSEQGEDISSLANNDTRPIFYNVGPKKLSDEERKYLLNKGIESLDWQHLDPSGITKDYEEQYSLLFSKVKSLEKNLLGRTDRTHDLFRSLIRYDALNAITYEELISFSSNYLSRIYFDNGKIYSINVINCLTYSKYLSGSSAISEKLRKECDYITRTFIKAGINLIDNGLEKIEPVNLFDLIKDRALLKCHSFYYDCVSFDYKKIESYLNVKCDYRLRNYALYKLGKYDCLLDSIEKKCNEFYSKDDKEIEFLLLKFNYDIAKKFNFARDKQIYHLNQIPNYKESSLRDNSNSFSIKVKSSCDGSILFKRTQNTSSDNSVYSNNEKNQILNKEIDLDKVNFSRLLEKLSYSIRLTYSYLIKSSSFPIPECNLKSIKSYCQNNISEHFSGYDLSYSFCEELLQSMIQIQRYLVINGIFKDKSDSFSSIVRESFSILLPIFSLKEGQILDENCEHKLVEFNNDIFFLMIEHCYSKELLDNFKYHSISKLYCGQRNESLSFVEKSINNLLNHANQYISKNGDSNKEISIRGYLSSIISKISNLTVICSYLNLSQRTSYNLAKFIFDNFSLALVCCPEEVFLYFSSILNESHRYDRRLKQLLTSWLKADLDRYVNYNNDVYHTALINLVLGFLFSNSNINWITPFYLSIFKQKTSKLYKFASSILSLYVSKKAKVESIEYAHSILDSRDMTKEDLELVIFIIKNNSNLSSSEIRKLKTYLHKIIDSYEISFYDSSSSFLPLAYYSTFGNIPRIFDEMSGFDGKFDFLYQYKNFDFSKFECDWLLNETEVALTNFFSDLYVKREIKSALKEKLKDKSLDHDKKSQFMDIFIKYCSDD